MLRNLTAALLLCASFIAAQAQSIVIGLPVGPTGPSSTLLADTFSGSDIGTKVNNAAVALPNDPYGVKTGTVQINGSVNSVYYFSNTISINSLTVTLDCQGATLVYTGTTVAIVESAPLRQNPSGGNALIAVGSPTGGIRNCNIQTLQSYLNSSGSNTPAGPSFVPSVTGLTVGATGTGYVTGDIVTIQQPGGALATALVTASGGAVISLSVLHGGYNYATGTGVATVGGTGTGLTVNITSVNPVVSCYPYNASATLPTGVFFGGDPTGRISGDSSSNYGNYVALYNTHISGFCAAVAFGNNVWQDQYYNVTLDHNYWGVDDEYNAAIANSGERSTFHGGRIDGNTGANIRSDNGYEMTLDGTSLDYSEGVNGSSQWISGVPVIGSELQIDFESTHIEDDFAPVIAETGAYRGYVNFHHGDIRLAESVSKSDLALFQIAGTGGYFDASGFVFNTEHTVSDYYYNPTNGASWYVYDPRLGSEGSLPTSYSTNGNIYGVGSSTVLVNGAGGQGYCFSSDLCMFRNGSGVLEVSSSAGAPNAQAFIEVGTLSLNGNISKVGAGGQVAVTQGNFGVPVVVASPGRLVAQTASIATTNLQCASAVCPAGFYRIHIYAEVGVTGTAGTLTASCGYTGASGAAVTVTPINQNTGVNTGISLSTYTSPLSAICELYTAGTANITYSTTVTGATGSPQYSISVYMERLQ